MSRIGKNPVVIGKDIKVELVDPKDNKNWGQTIVLKTSKSTQMIQVKPEILCEVNDTEVILNRANDEKQTRAYHGLYRSLLQNAMTGLVDGWSKTLILNGVGYRSAVKGKVLELNLGYSHPINFDIPDGIDIKVEKQTTVTVTGVDKALVGQVSAKIRGFRPPEPFLGKGIRYSDEHIRRKAGKSAGK